MRKPPASSNRLLIRYGLGLVLVVAVYLYGTGRLDQLARGGFGSSPPGAPVIAEAWGEEIRSLSAEDIRLLDEQRSLVAELARRHAGAPALNRSRADLRTLQRLLDLEVLAPNQRFELQALGVVLGDVMAESLGLSWVVLHDRYGRSRALRFRDTSNLLFPVTMISRRVEKGIPVDVLALYQKMEDEVRSFGQSRL